LGFGIASFNQEPFMKKIAVLVSGGGSNLQSIIDSVESGTLKVEIVLVLSNKEGAFGLERAAKQQIPTAVIKHGEFPDREAFETRLMEVIDGHGAELVVLAGFMRVLTPHFVNHYHHRIMNIHPALLPSFPGTHGQKQALGYGVRYAGCTIHFVDEGTDTGPIIMQAVVPILPDDTEGDLSARILVEEHRIYPESLRLWSEGRLLIEGRKVRILGEGSEKA
jgi:phosphoribosylglycinamide formyltransferase-1